jgi:hypothetical protein
MTSAMPERSASSDARAVTVSSGTRCSRAASVRSTSASRLTNDSGYQPLSSSATSSQLVENCLNCERAMRTSADERPSSARLRRASMASTTGRTSAIDCGVPSRSLSGSAMRSASSASPASAGCSQKICTALGRSCGLRASQSMRAACSAETTGPELTNQKRTRPRAATGLRRDQGQEPCRSSYLPGLRCATAAHNHRPMGSLSPRLDGTGNPPTDGVQHHGGWAKLVTGG